MFQTFESTSNPDAVPGRVKQLRGLMDTLRVDAVLVPRADEHQGEYVPLSAERLKWLTGFGGSAGLAIVARRAAALFVDGRYTVQVRSETDTRVFEILQVPDAKPSDWLIRHLERGAVVGFDPWLHTVGDIEALTAALKIAGIILKPLPYNPIDRVWGRDRPAPPSGAIVPQPAEQAGKDAARKIAELQETLKSDNQDAVILTLPDSIAWLFNIRGSDVAHNPVPLAFAIVPAKGRPELFVDKAKIGPNVAGHVEAVARITSPATLAKKIAGLKASNKRVRLDPGSAAWWFYRKLGGKAGRIARAADPCLLPKARKNEAEIKGTRNAHRRDGVAMARFLAWLDRETPTGRIDEIGAVRMLENFRRETGQLAEISFDTISGSGPHGAIVHYRVNEKTNRRLQAGELFLIDSGAQYHDGTTDITRTVAVGKPTAEMRDRFTRVLQGHIAIATARFPKGTRGIELDPFARRSLWQAGLDYDHGTGHGVGSFLSVHEGPQSISRRGMVPLEAGMIVSNEPGYYKEGAYGIRIENLLVVTPPEAIAGGDREMLGFETLTLAPIDRRLILTTLLSPTERDWIDVYHARVAKLIGPQLKGEDRVWLDAATAPLTDPI